MAVGSYRGSLRPTCRGASLLGPGQCLPLGDIPVGTFVISEDSDQRGSRPLLTDDNLDSLQLWVDLTFQEQARLPMDLNQLPWAAF